jgi:hypothetical protein
VARRVFFSFHYERDIVRVNQVRNCWVTQDREVAGFWDASLWEEAKKKGDAAIKKMIDNALENTSVTVVLIGSETADREYVRYEISQSHNRGNGLLGVYVHDLKNFQGKLMPKEPILLTGYGSRRDTTEGTFLPFIRHTIGQCKRGTRTSRVGLRPPRLQQDGRLRLANEDAMARPRTRPPSRSPFRNRMVDQ